MTEAGTAWTPGPYKWHWRSEDGIATGSVFSEKTTGHAYAVAVCPRYQTRKQWEKDAPLIAEAFNVAIETGLTPRQLAERAAQRDELLAALKESEEAIDAALAMVEHDHGHPNWDWLRGVRSRSRAAIARAEARATGGG